VSPKSIDPPLIQRGRTAQHSRRRTRAVHPAWSGSWNTRCRGPRSVAWRRQGAASFGPANRAARPGPVFRLETCWCPPSSFIYSCRGRLNWPASASR
jgi:hypothetical protein